MSERDCKGWEYEKLPMSTTNNDAAKLYDSAITQYVTWSENPTYGGIEGTVKKMLECDPGFTMGSVLSIGLDLMGTASTIRLNNELESDVLKLESSIDTKLMNSREKLHCRAVSYFAHEEYTKACETWEQILVDFPNDILALKFAHDSYFYLGNSNMIRDSVGRVLPFLKPTSRFYGYVKGMYAFGLEETNYFDLAEKYSREALAMNPTDCWATHALAHCFEMTGRAREGIDFMRKTEDDWRKGAMLACHNYWHWSLYHIELGQNEETIALYDKEVNERMKSGAPLDLVDAASLLKRLEFQGVNVGDRWNDVYDQCRARKEDHILTFNDVHYLMGFLGARSIKEDIAQDFITSVTEYLSQGSGTNHDIMSSVGMSICNALVCYQDEQFDAAVEYLYPEKYKIVDIGGSNAQRDVFSQLLIFSCIQSKQAKHLKLGQALIHERKLMKENSPLTDRMMNRLMSCHASA